jgi:hypothetical protein
MLAQPLIAHNVAGAVGMLAAIDFDDQMPFATNEVDNVSPYRLLADELMSVDRSRAQLIPKAQFGTG